VFWMQSSCAAAPRTLADENGGLVANTNGHQPSYSMLFSELTALISPRITAVCIQNAETEEAQGARR
jgi:hypothetical protein